MEPIPIGKVIPVDATPSRDAIHVAVAPVVSDEKLWPGQRVGIANEKASATAKDIIGIVDPFLTDAVYPGTRFYLFLFPGSITSLCHEWTHPAFDGAEPKPGSASVEASREWLQQFAESLGGDDDGPMTCDRLINAADRWVAYGDYLVQHGSESWRRDTDDLTYRDFWHHYEVVRGVRVQEPDAHFFSCSC